MQALQPHPWAPGGTWAKTNQTNQYVALTVTYDVLLRIITIYHNIS